MKISRLVKWLSTSDAVSKLNEYLDLIISEENIFESALAGDIKLVVKVSEGTGYKLDQYTIEQIISNPELQPLDIFGPETDFSGVYDLCLLGAGRSLLQRYISLIKFNPEGEYRLHSFYDDVSEWKDFLFITDQVNGDSFALSSLNSERQFNILDVELGVSPSDLQTLIEELEEGVKGSPTSEKRLSQLLELAFHILKVHEPAFTKENGTYNISKIADIFEAHGNELGFDGLGKKSIVAYLTPILSFKNTK
ncbi:hypothetical protein XMD420_000958 [Marinobacterium sp. xm-d-420]|uniref:hypothetical protein n=1 Tax=Marinobacterium sp. xm-d-420 TaxID=2497737 RepID=UPI001568495A|nr:hypothetical protein [Marinobacterium sp. xm-d-420]NRP27355.1 hypothetical protein [Marinobacterium sp. xm-d-420]